jgi:hypothetical protein
VSYVEGNPKTKKDLKAKVARGNAYAFESGVGSLPKYGGDITVEGPQFPEPHKWYARVRVDDQGKIIKVLG